MCPIDDSHLTLEFHDHFVIRPTITFTDRNNSYTTNKLNEESTPVKEGFEYNSGSNEKFLKVPEILDFNNRAGIE